MLTDYSVIYHQDYQGVEDDYSQSGNNYRSYTKAIASRQEINNATEYLFHRGSRYGNWVYLYSTADNDWVSYHSKPWQVSELPARKAAIAVTQIEFRVV